MLSGVKLAVLRGSLRLSILDSELGVSLQAQLFESREHRNVASDMQPPRTYDHFWISGDVETTCERCSSKYELITLKNLIG